MKDSSALLFPNCWLFSLLFSLYSLVFSSFSFLYTLVFSSFSFPNTKLFFVFITNLSSLFSSSLPKFAAFSLYSLVLFSFSFSKVIFCLRFSFPQVNKSQLTTNLRTLQSPLHSSVPKLPPFLNKSSSGFFFFSLQS